MNHPTANRTTETGSLTGRQWIGLVVAAELLLLVAYFGLTPAEPTSIRYALYPFVWINIGLYAVLKASSPTVEGRYRLAGAIIAGGYFLVLAVVSGLIVIPLGQYDGTHAVSGVHVTMGAPGWGPAVAYVGPGFQLTFVPYLVIGYLSLAYLVYLTVAEATGAAISGVLGLVSCVGCTFPVVASLVAGFAGGTSGLTTAVYSLSVDISTAIFVLAIALLYWQPEFRSHSRE